MPRTKGPKKNPLTVNLTDEGRRLLDVLSEALGVSMTAIIEISVRRMAKAEGLETPGPSATVDDETGQPPN